MKQRAQRGTPVSGASGASGGQAGWRWLAIAGLGLASCQGKPSFDANKVVAEPGFVDPSICETLGSAQWAGKYFAGLRRSEKATKLTPEVVECDLRFGDARVQLQCGAKVNDAAALALARQQYASLASSVEGLGALAFAFGPDELQFWDDDSTCTVPIRAAHLGAELVPAARALAAELGQVALATGR